MGHLAFTARSVDEAYKIFSSTPENWHFNGCLLAPNYLIIFGIVQNNTKLVVGPDYEYFDLSKTFKSKKVARRSRLPEIVEFQSVGSGILPLSRGKIIAKNFFNKGYRGIFWANKKPLKAACSLRETTIWIEWRDEPDCWESVTPFITACVHAKMKITSEELKFFPT